MDTGQKRVARFSTEKVYIAESVIPGAGRGVFALCPIRAGEAIEQSPIIELPRESRLIRKSKLYHYYFRWGERQTSCAIALGFGSLYNHSYEPNATYHKNIETESVAFVAIKDIAQNEEITVNYNNGDPDDKRPLWIASIKPPAAARPLGFTLLYKLWQNK